MPHIPAGSKVDKYNFDPTLRSIKDVLILFRQSLLLPKTKLCGRQIWQANMCDVTNCNIPHVRIAQSYVRAKIRDRSELAPLQNAKGSPIDELNERVWS